MLEEVCDIWVKAGIRIRFKLKDIRSPHTIPYKASEVFQWWLTSPKPFLSGKSFLVKDTHSTDVLASKVGNETVKKVINKFRSFNGHTLFNWILGKIKEEFYSKAFFHIYIVRFYPWYNGGTTKGRIFIRSGACDGFCTDFHKYKVKEENKLPLKEKTVLNTEARNKLNGEYGDNMFNYGEAGMLKAEFIRVLAHEIGHSLGLKHTGTKCEKILLSRSNKGELMRQQRYVGTKETGCFEGNVASVIARTLSKDEIEKARKKAKWMENLQRKAYEKVLDELSENSFHEFDDSLIANQKKEP
eukprot:snap_masked-scaffold_14-processed-gene-3.55-mRNA-1 protein AED:0.94 eAED:1.00 QI:0/0/0/0.5/1/1/2/0/299